MLVFLILAINQLPVDVCWPKIKCLRKDIEFFFFFHFLIIKIKYPSSCSEREYIYLPDLLLLFLLFKYLYTRYMIIISPRKPNTPNTVPRTICNDFSYSVVADVFDTWTSEKSKDVTWIGYYKKRDILNLWSLSTENMVEFIWN